MACPFRATESLARSTLAPPARAERRENLVGAEAGTGDEGHPNHGSLRLLPLVGRSDSSKQWCGNVSECGPSQPPNKRHHGPHGRTSAICESPRKTRGLLAFGRLDSVGVCVVGTPGFEPGGNPRFSEEIGYVSENVSDQAPRVTWCRRRRWPTVLPRRTREGSSTATSSPDFDVLRPVVELNMQVIVDDEQGPGQGSGAPLHRPPPRRGR